MPSSSFSASLRDMENPEAPALSTTGGSISERPSVDAVVDVGAAAVSAGGPAASVVAAAFVVATAAVAIAARANSTLAAAIFAARLAKAA